MVEQKPEELRVGGSIPSLGTIFYEWRYLEVVGVNA
ncbi:MAG: hypothetical protein UW09_C0003G0166 [candidate division TM6 bacterium GW2011_GWF2_43_87]|nr:MAG: hypothetical protein UW09_C0003G0166 [candidate division TM6 bacterium GW2011_GWF2_43_87]